MDRISKALEQARQNVVKTKASPDVAAKSDAPRNPVKTRSVSLSPHTLRENRIISGGDDGPVIDVYGLLRTRVLKAMRKNNWKTLGITSPDPSVGKTLTSINLAISIALDHNYSVLLIDADLRRPSIANTLGLDPGVGLSDYLGAGCSIEEMLVRPKIEDMVIAPTNRVDSGSSELLSSPKMTQFVKEAKERYPERLVIFDLPPVLVGDDVVALSQHLDALLLVVEDGKTQANDLTRSIQLLHDINILGVVLNKGNVIPNQYDEYYK